MKLNFRVIRDEETNEKYVKMKCLECGYEETIPLDILLEFFRPDVDEVPSMTCPHCDVDAFVPEDVYDQIKGNFVYKFKK